VRFQPITGRRSISTKKPSCREGRRATAYTVSVARSSKVNDFYHFKNNMRLPISNQ